MCNEFLLSPRSAVTVKATRKDDIFTFDVSALAANASKDFSPSSTPAVAELAALGLSYTVYLSLLQTSGGITPADISFEFRLADEKRLGLLGAELSPNNANACAINACDMGVCVGALEDLTIRIKNETLAAFPAGATVKMKVTRAFSGDGAKYICDRDAASLQRDCRAEAECNSCGMQQQRPQQPVQ